MKTKEGRDYIETENHVVSFRDGMIRISDAGATFDITEKDFKKMVDFVTKKQREVAIKVYVDKVNNSRTTFDPLNNRMVK